MILRDNKAVVALGSLLCTGMIFFSSCTAGFEEINDPKEAVSGRQLAVDNYNAKSFIAQLIDQAFPEQENAYQMNYDLIGNYLGRYFSYTVAGWSGKNFATFSAPNGWVRYPYRDVKPKVESAMAEIKRIASIDGAQPTENVIYNWGLILRAHALLSLTDKYGPLAIGLDETDLSLYNSQEAIYKALLADLNAAITYLQKTNPGNLGVSEDKVYGGDMAKWLKFANSLKLRMAIRIRHVEPTLAEQYAKEAVAAGVIESNDDNALRSFNPRGLFKVSVDWGDSRACADIDSYMNGYADPRLPYYFSPTATAGARDVIGVLAGANIGNKDVAVKLYSAANTKRDTPGIWMTASEMYFCRAEGALAGWTNMGGTTEELYTKAVETSFAQWGAGSATAYLQSTSTPADYDDAAGGYGSSLPRESSITPKWNDTASDAEKLERLIVQKWIALFPNGQEAWNEIRRTGYPKVFDIQTSKAGYSLRVPNRIPFDSEERVNNPKGYASALKALGGEDSYATKMWWQKN